MVDPVSTAIASGAGKVASNLITPEANNTPRQDLTKASDQAAYKRGEATAGQSTNIEGVIESIETIAKLYMNAPPEMRIKYLKDLQDLLAKTAQNNLALREKKESQKYEIFQKREDGYLSAQYSAQQNLYSEQIGIRKQATGGITSTASLKGMIASWAFAINDLLGGSLGEMPTMKKWLDESQAFTVNMSDIKRPERVDLDFKEQPNALISNAVMQREVNELTAAMRSSGAIAAGQGLADSIKPTIDNPTPVLHQNGASANTKAAIAENATDATKQAPKPAGAASAAMFVTPEATEEADKAIKKAQASSKGVSAAKMFADPAPSLK